MSELDTYRQVRIEKGSLADIVWIPSRLAKPGATVRFGESDGWRVVETFGLKRGHEDDWRRSLPSIERSVPARL